MRQSVAFSATLMLIGAGCIVAVERSRILAIETIGSKSRWNFMRSVLGALTENGHSVTAFTPFPEGDRANYTEVDVSTILPLRVAMGFAEQKTMFKNFRKVLEYLIAVSRSVCDGLRDDGRLNEILKGGLRGKFDALIVEPSVTDCLTRLAADAGLPVIFSVPTSTIFSEEFRSVGHVSNPAIVSTMLSEHGVLKTFAQRFDNTVSTVYNNMLLAVQRQLYRTFDPKPYDSDVSIPPSLVFINSHFVSEVSSPVPSSVVRVGGIHLKPVEKLPRDILEFVENSPRGVVLFTFGSTVSMTSIPASIQKEFLDALSQLPQRVLLTYDGELRAKPQNVMTKKWLPQRDILKHPKVKLFISHGGISGFYEAVDAGVPVLGFPIIGDQYRNIDHLVEAGMAISMDVLSITKNTLLTNILELINNEKYIKNAKKTSKIFNDRPLSPQSLVVYWTEYVIRHKGATHLQSPGLDLTWYQYFLLDVISAMLLLICISIIIFYKMCNMIKYLVVKVIHLTTKMKSE